MHTEAACTVTHMFSLTCKPFGPCNLLWLDVRGSTLVWSHHVLCARGISLGTPVCFHTPKTWTLGSLEVVNCPSECVCVCMHACLRVGEGVGGFWSGNKPGPFPLPTGTGSNDHQTWMDVQSHHGSRWSRRWGVIQLVVKVPLASYSFLNIFNFTHADADAINEGMEELT